MANERGENEGRSRFGEGIIPDADYLLSKARALFRAARDALLAGERERLEDQAHQLETRAAELERTDRYGSSFAGDKPRRDNAGSV
jgi:hypothetical protein